MFSYLFFFLSQCKVLVSDGKVSFWVYSICFWVCTQFFTTPWMQLGLESSAGNRESNKHRHCYRFIQKLMHIT